MKHITAQVLNLYENNIDTPNVEELLADFILATLVNELKAKNINSFGDWLNYYSTRKEEFLEFQRYSNSYYYKAQLGQDDQIGLDEKIAVFTALALYVIEMDVDCPTGEIMNTVLNTFFNVVRRYNLVFDGYLYLKGEVLISDNSRFKYHSSWSHQDEPII